MSAKRFPIGLEVYDLGTRRLYVKTSTGFVLHSDDLTVEELLLIAQDITRHNGRPGGKECLKPGHNPKLGSFHGFSF